MSRRACGREVRAGGTLVDCGGGIQQRQCSYERMKGKQRCVWHWLLAQSSDVQAEYARKRLRAAEGCDFRARIPQDEWPDGERWCAGCQSFVPRFYVSGSRCKACASSAAHERRVESIYGISGDEYRAIFARQGGRCAICRSQPRTIRFAVDHDHKTGEVRGILCKRCNHDLLGGGHDDVETLWRAVEYLLFPPATHTGPRPSTETVMAALGDRLYLLARLRAPSPVESKPAPF